MKSSQPRKLWEDFQTGEVTCMGGPSDDLSVLLAELQRHPGFKRQMVKEGAGGLP